MEPTGKTGYFLIIKIREHQFACSLENVSGISGGHEMVSRIDENPMLVGEISVSGNIIPVFDISEKIQEKRGSIHNFQVVVVKIHNQDKQLKAGILVNEVSEVRKANEREISEFLFGKEYIEDHTRGLLKVRDKELDILDLSTIFSSEDICLVEKTFKGNYLMN